MLIRNCSTGYRATARIAPFRMSLLPLMAIFWALAACAAQPIGETSTGAGPGAVPTITPRADETPGETHDPGTPEALACNKTRAFQVGGTDVWKIPEKQAFFFSAGMAIDADGAPDAYHPENIGKDHLGNAGRPGNWWALVTDTGDPSGTPLIQQAGDPSPGFYISATALEDRTKPTRDPKRYVDSNTIPYLVLPSNQRGGARLGDLGFAVNRANGKSSPAIFADLGPRNKLGEGSIKLAERLGVPANPRHGGASRGIVYVVFPGSGNGKPKTLQEIDDEGKTLFEAWGGMRRLDACLR